MKNKENNPEPKSKGNNMKKIVEEVQGEGLESLLGENVEVLCFKYIYHGKLSGVNEKDILITDASIIFDTGPYDKEGYADIEKLNRDVYVRIDSIESYSLAK